MNKVYLIHRRPDFRGLVCYQDKCFTHEKIEVVRNTLVDEIQGENGVESLALRDATTGEARQLKVDGSFIFVGFEPIMEFVPDDIKKESNGVVTDVEMRTNVPGIFAAGDIRAKMCRQVASAVGDGATAANAVFTYLEQLGV